jgi:hypothetical protein
VRFEPTPATRARTVPGYTTYQFPTPSDSALPSQGASSQEVANRTKLSDPHEKNPQNTGGAGVGGFRVPWDVVFIGIGVLVLLVLLALTPRYVRGRRREARLREGPEPVWIELRDTVVDLGLTWPASRSPRETGSHLVHYFGRPVGTDPADRPRHGADVSPEAERALQRIVSTLEVQRYARPGTEQAAILKADAETVIASLVGGVTPGARRRAEWLPRSLWVSARRPAVLTSVSAGGPAYGGVVDHVGG